MANRNIKGITIEIGGNTTKLQDALKKVDSQVYNLNTDLRDVNKALKLDPKNTEMLSQKYKLLGENVSVAKQRLETLKEAQRQMDVNGVDKNSDQYRALQREIAITEGNIKSAEEEMKKLGKVDLSKLKDTLKKVGEVAVDVAKKLAKITTAAAGAIVGVVSLGIKSYASLEQNIGAIEKLYGKSANTLIENSKNAYKTAGISANQYMETATSFSASLLKGLGGDSKKAAELTDRAIRDMSDNANTFGSSMDEVMNVYKALSKEQYTTLDNLRLGYAGTKTGMKQLIHDASTYKDIQKELNITVKDGDMSFSNIINAISVMQKHLKITGTTQKEAEKTITGSLNSLKAAFDNFLNGTGTPEQLADAFSNFAINVGTAFDKLLPAIVRGLTETVKKVLPLLVDILSEQLPHLLDEMSNLIDTILSYLVNNQQALADTIGMVVSNIVQFFTENLPKVVKFVLTLYTTLAKAFTNKETLDILIKSILECINELLKVLIESLPLLIEALSEVLLAIIKYFEDHFEELKVAETQIIVSLGKLLITLIPVILKVIWEVLKAIVSYIGSNIGLFLDKGKEIVKELAKGITDKIPSIKEKTKELIEKIKEELAKLPSKALNWGKDMVQGLINGIKSKVDGVKNAAKDVADKIKNFLHFSRPDEGPLREYETWMPDFVRGLARTLRDSSYLLEDASLDMATTLANNTSAALRGLNAGVNASLNPTINPSYSYDLNYQLMAQAMKEALKEVNVELDDRELGKFIDKQVSEEVYS